MLTKKQKEVFVYIRDFLQSKGYAPSQQEIKEHFSFASTSTAEYYLKNLKDKNYITFISGKARTIEIINQDHSAQPNLNSSISATPILGYANAGVANVYAEESIEGYIQTPKHLVGTNNLFALIVDGDSMDMAVVNHKIIKDGSIIFVEGDKRSPKENDIVLSVINGCANIKKFCFDTERNLAVLKPVSNNGEHKSIYLNNEDDFQVNGTVVDVV